MGDGKAGAGPQANGDDEGTRVDPQPEGRGYGHRQQQHRRGIVAQNLGADAGQQDKTRQDHRRPGPCEKLQEALAYRSAGPGFLHGLPQGDGAHDQHQDIRPQRPVGRAQLEASGQDHQEHTGQGRHHDGQQAGGRRGDDHPTKIIRARAARRLWTISWWTSSMTIQSLSLRKLAILSIGEHTSRISPIRSRRVSGFSGRRSDGRGA